MPEAGNKDRWGYCIRYAMPPEDKKIIYHTRNGKASGLPIAFIREGMHQSAEILVEYANKAISTKRSIYDRRPK